jgi:uncharacterized protein (DUF3084 family)
MTIQLWIEIFSALGLAGLFLRINDGLVKTVTIQKLIQKDIEKINVALGVIKTDETACKLNVEKNLTQIRTVLELKEI